MCIGNRMAVGADLCVRPGKDCPAREKEHGRQGKAGFIKIGTLSRELKLKNRYGVPLIRADLTCEQPHGYGVVRQNKFTVLSRH